MTLMGGKPAGVLARTSQAQQIMCAAAATPSLGLWNSQAMMFASQVKKRETLREREDRRRELSNLMETWQCTVGFEFHVQMNSRHKMFSSK